jgi:hypothetical protein
MIDNNYLIPLLIPMFVILNSIILEYLKYAQDVNINSYSGYFSFNQHFKDVLGSLISTDSSISGMLKFGIAFFVNTWIVFTIMGNKLNNFLDLGSLFLIYIIYLSFKALFYTSKSEDSKLMSEVFIELVITIFIWLNLFIFEWAYEKNNIENFVPILIPLVATTILVSRILKRINTFNSNNILENYDVFTLCFLTAALYLNKFMDSVEITTSMFITFAGSYIYYLISTRAMREISVANNKLEFFYFKYVLIFLTIQGSVLLYYLF